MQKFVLITILAVAGSACSFVKVSDAGASVTQASAPDVINCKNLGVIESNTRAKVLFKRNSATVRQELIDLARDQAAGMGANAIVPLGEPVEGRQKFTAYRCS